MSIKDALIIVALILVIIVCAIYIHAHLAVQAH